MKTTNSFSRSPVKRWVGYGILSIVSAIGILVYLIYFLKPTPPYGPIIPVFIAAPVAAVLVAILCFSRASKLHDRASGIEEDPTEKWVFIDQLGRSAVLGGMAGTFLGPALGIDIPGIAWGGIMICGTILVLIGYVGRKVAAKRHGKLQ